MLPGDSSQRQFPIDPSKVSIPRDSSGRDLLEKQVIEQITARLKPNEREAVLLSIQDERLGRAWTVRGDQELSRLFAVLYAIRDARIDEEGLRSRCRIAATQSAKVLVAIVEAFEEPGTFAQIRRSTGPEAGNVVLILKSALTTETLATALGAVSRSRRTDGDFPRTELIVSLRAKDASLVTQHSARAAQLLAQLSSAAVQDVPGIGALTTAEVILPPESPL